MPGVRAGSQLHLRSALAKASLAAAHIDEIHGRAGSQTCSRGFGQASTTISDKATTIAISNSRRPR